MDAETPWVSIRFGPQSCGSRRSSGWPGSSASPDARSVALFKRGRCRTLSLAALSFECRHPQLAQVRASVSPRVSNSTRNVPGAWFPTRRKFDLHKVHGFPCRIRFVMERTRISSSVPRLDLVALAGGVSIWVDSRWRRTGGGCPGGSASSSLKRRISVRRGSIGLARV